MWQTWLFQRDIPHEDEVFKYEGHVISGAPYHMFPPGQRAERARALRQWRAMKSSWHRKVGRGAA